MQQKPKIAIFYPIKMSNSVLEFEMEYNSYG